MCIKIKRDRDVVQTPMHQPKSDTISVEEAVKAIEAQKNLELFGDLPEIVPDEPDPPYMVPAIEENIPLPKNAREALPPLSNEEELEMMANTIRLIAELSGTPLETTKEDIEEAKSVAEAMIRDPDTKIQLKKYKNATLASLAGMVESLNVSVVDDLSELKHFVVNGLIKEAATAEKSKERITALRAIGEVDGVNAFKSHAEVVHTNMSMDDIEAKLKVLVNKIQKRVEYEVPYEVPSEATEVIEAEWEDVATAEEDEEDE